MIDPLRSNRLPRRHYKAFEVSTAEPGALAEPRFFDRSAGVNKRADSRGFFDYK